MQRDIMIKYIKTIFLAIFAPTKLVREKVVIETKILKDPNGFIKQDMIFLKKHLGSKQYKLGDTLEEVAYNRGQSSVVDFIDNILIGRKTNGSI